ncbi:1,4-dihydroxy-2-naphthoate octaprenyltransferase [Anaerosporobacter mobilis DSM 15930]|jgi:1,4-dihydroxy-2-naphthoate octaprenyltransferase|uniref:1,4-dihydroxy-2-naphthoate octaprenyltransferase n=1 Tax=Anaerosporobacter mobilis DSM 15930 TaxID=1120996 RepID=A0A1M7G0S9_9FIRM|nr:UbiA family prenyltransferase [Anaerosporobacter mobilis]SHM09816.1 1,4-dihydroxy-2-naphthoate octaprenyltransferase [Anaerosporobacter mobilis DSM 15930]
MVKRFLDYVEIRTKITSTFAFIMTIALLVYHKQSIDWKLTLVFFASMFLFDLTTTAINNYIDTKTNNQTLQFKRKTALIIILVLFGISTVLGLYLAYMSDIVIFLIGGLCFLCGVFYTFGPLPISRMPLGEFFSGLFYGFFIPFIILYLNTPKGTFLSFDINSQSVSVELMIWPIASLLLFAIIPFCTTANIMLANNMCDLKKDILVKRHTLPYYVGKKSIYLYAGIYYMTYLATIVMVVVGILSPICLLSLFTILIVQKNIKQFMKKQDKATTFILSIKNYVIIMGVNTLLIFISALFN